VRSLLDRRPLVFALGEWVVLFVLVQGTVAAASDVHERTWTVWVLFGAVLYAAFAMWLVSRMPTQNPAATPSVLRMALAASPVLIASGLAFQGAPGWSLWLTFAASGLLLGEGVLLARWSASSHD
jgi:hypothetical protein